MTSDPVEILKERLVKAEGKVARHRKALVAAEAEARDIQTALRVFSEVMNPATEAKSSESGSTLERQRQIVMLLGNGREKAKPPADLYPAHILITGEDINIDTFRTTIWRMKDRVYDLDDGKWIVEGENGNYWKRPVEAKGNIEELLGRPFDATQHADFGDSDLDDLDDLEDPPF